MGITTTTIQNRLDTLGLSQAKVCRRLEIGEAHFNRIVLGRVKPNLNLALRIAAELDVSVEELWPEKVA